MKNKPKTYFIVEYKLRNEIENEIVCKSEELKKPNNVFDFLESIKKKYSKSLRWFKVRAYKVEDVTEPWKYLIGDK